MSLNKASNLILKWQSGALTTHVALATDYFRVQAAYGIYELTKSKF